MLKSMTGYSKVTESDQNKTISVEIKSLNAKSFTPILKIPDAYSEKELDIKNLLTNHLIGGKVNFNLSIVHNSPKTIEINQNLLQAYIGLLNDAAQKNGLDSTQENILSIAIKMPDVLINQTNSVDSDEWEMVKNVISKALEQIDQFRSTEGKALETDILQNIRAIESLLDHVGQFEEERIVNVKNRLKIKLNEFLNANDQNIDRFEQEIIYYLEKFDINEEKVRLKNHCSYFIETMQNNDPVGSKLGFIAQEIGREINTIGSKANHSEIQKIVVNMKDALEKVKEQIFNIL